jgi:hypothetical protein
MREIAQFIPVLTCGLFRGSAAYVWLSIGPEWSVESNSLQPSSRPAIDAQQALLLFLYLIPDDLQKAVIQKAVIRWSRKLESPCGRKQPSWKLLSMQGVDYFPSSKSKVQTRLSRKPTHR